MASLSRIPFARLGVTKELVRALPWDPDSAAIVKTVISLAHRLDLPVVAEGIERKEQMVWLKANRCDYGQGYYIGKPLPPDEIWGGRIQGVMVWAYPLH